MEAMDEEEGEAGAEMCKIPPSELKEWDVHSNSPTPSDRDRVSSLGGRHSLIMHALCTPNQMRIFGGPAFYSMLHCHDNYRT
jgi:hypothetical protein